ncbi:MerR family transcriptional regulator [Convivina praedatoris]|uniref:HTH-type transcriptional regulator n=1 Tax=Convivina praedatoris TaxID=2880963 RepID=A0ABM9D0P2_9LACO|nr:MerR family transcriptional regulator [Convivina sp. LMG 32447]CAH1852000.1 putative HTH-type transcriptional regulator [Convivina sp. LMG 32447]CAH1852033.1 putative HTH-type transcriptional regulator [Convivina sp. LMG 32447]CAH1852895.1 putative HTH-type transcriptional regulator [Convivina sp. LMG 32447]
MGTRQYHVGKFAKLLGVTTYTVRYYEQEGLLQFNKVNNQRIYDDQDVLWFQFLQHLKGAGFSLAEMKQYVKLRVQGDSTIAQRETLLREKQAELKKEIKQKQTHLAVVKDKINFYQLKQTKNYNGDFATFRQHEKKSE